MNQGKINVRYAKALFSLGKEAGILRELHNDMAGVLKLTGQSAEFRELLDNPVIKTSQKKTIFREVFETRVHELTLRFLLLVTNNNREKDIPGICRDFLDMVRSSEGILPAVITTASPLSPGSLENIRQALEKETGKTIELTEMVKPEILGGMVMRIEDRQFDGSIAAQLKKIRASLLA